MDFWSTHFAGAPSAEFVAHFYPRLVAHFRTAFGQALPADFDVHLRLWADALGADAFPSLHAHRAGVAAQPSIAAYLGADEGASRRRWSRLNGNALG